MQLEIISLAGVTFEGEVSEVRVPTESGEIGILPHHEDLVSVVSPGTVEVTPKGGGKPQQYVVFGGLVDVTARHTRVLVDEAEHIDSLIEAEIVAALAEAERLEASATDTHQQVQASRMVARQSVRLGAVRRRHHHSGSR